VVAPISREQQRHGSAIHGTTIGQSMLAEEELAHQAAHRPSARLARAEGAALSGPQMLDQSVELRGGS
jgi:hypothetical protein